MTSKLLPLRLTALISILFIAAYSAALTAWSQPGTLEASFGNAGIALTDIAGAADDAKAMVLQPDGKVLIAGATYAGGAGSFFLARYLANGDPDPDFGVFGKVTTLLTTQGDAAMELVQRPDGRSIAIGYSNGGADGITAVQYLPDGTVDLDFGVNGVAIVPNGYTLQVRAGLTSTGYLICAANNEATQDWRVIRLTPGGQLDEAFGDAGSRYIDAGLGQTEYVEDLIVLDDDRTLLVGWSADVLQNTFAALAQLTATGDLDPTFAIDGTALIDYQPGTNNEIMRSAVQLPDSRLLLTGDGVVDGSQVIRISRLFPDGSLDLAYGTGGETVDSIPGRQVHSYAIGVQADGRAVVAGTSYDDVSQNDDIALWRFTGNGTLDETFGDQGITLTDIGPVDHTNAIVMDDNRFFVTGRTDVFTTYDAFVAAYGNGLNVGIEVRDRSDKLLLAPNPTSGEVRMTGPDAAEGRITVRDASGRVVLDQLRQTHSVTMDLTGLEAGLYLVEWSTGPRVLAHWLVVE